MRVKMALLFFTLSVSFEAFVIYFSLTHEKERKKEESFIKIPDSGDCRVLSLFKQDPLQCIKTVLKSWKKSFKRISLEKEYTNKGLYKTSFHLTRIDVVMRV